MDNLASELAHYLVDKLREKPDSDRLLVGISGVPASGKSTFAKDVVGHCNSILSMSKADTEAGKKVEAILVGLDGWHLTLAQLDAFPDPRIAHDRRGAHWTFDGAAYAEFISELRIPVYPTADGLESHIIIKAPSFDHALKDPSPGSVSILPGHRIVVIQGLYTFLSIEPWRAAGESLDERWFIDVDFEVAKRRLVKRHVLTGVAKDTDEAIWRADNNDMPNGKFVMENMLPPTRRITSVDDPPYAETVDH